MRVRIVILFAGLIAACGGGSDTVTNAPPPPATNNPPTISGSPAVSVVRDQAYSFTPVASDPDGDSLTFSVSNQPPWSDFDSTNGRLTGTPGAASVGTTPAVTIAVSDGAATASLAPFDLEVVEVQLGSATVSWDAPLTSADGSLLTDLAAYRVHYGETAGSYTAVVVVGDPATTTVRIDNLESGTWYFVVTALDQTGNESDFSAEVSKVVSP